VDTRYIVSSLLTRGAFGVLSVRKQFPKKGLRMSVKTTVMYLLVAAGVAHAQVQLNIQPGVQLSWPTPNTTNTYHLQWSPSSGGTWSDLVAAVTGNGTTHTSFDPFIRIWRLFRGYLRLLRPL
jgi:hypothetical protein